MVRECTLGQSASSARCKGGERESGIVLCGESKEGRERIYCVYNIDEKRTEGGE